MGQTSERLPRRLGAPLRQMGQQWRQRPEWHGRHYWAPPFQSLPRASAKRFPSSVGAPLQHASVPLPACSRPTWAALDSSPCSSPAWAASRSLSARALRTHSPQRRTAPVPRRERSSPGPIARAQLAFPLPRTASYWAPLFPSLPRASAQPFPSSVEAPLQAASVARLAWSWSSPALPQAASRSLSPQSSSEPVARTQRTLPLPRDASYWAQRAPALPPDGLGWLWSVMSQPTSGRPVASRLTWSQAPLSPVPSLRQVVSSSLQARTFQTRSPQLRDASN